MKLKDDKLTLVIKNPITVNSKTSLLDARQILLKNKIGRIVISENDKPIGIITEKDLIKSIYRIDAKPLESLRVSDIMSTDLITANDDSTLQDCAKLMLDNKISSILILKNKFLHGIITKTDLVSVFLTHVTDPLKISKIMTRSVVTVKPADSLLYVESVLVNHKISRVVVERNHSPVGIITHRDFIPAKIPLWLKQSGDPLEIERHALSSKEYRKNQLSYLLTFIASDIMTPNPIVIDSNDDVSNAALLMVRHDISGLPVVKGRVLSGIITKTDIVRAMSG